MGSRIIQFCFVSALALVLAAGADTVTTKNGSQLVGKVKSIEGGTVKLETDFAGTISIGLGQVTSMKTDDNVSIKLKNGNRISGALAEGAGGQQVATDNGTLTFKVEDVDALWQPDEESPEVRALKARVAAQQPKWKTEAGLSIDGRTGNSEKFSASGRLQFTRTTIDDTLKLFIQGTRARENSVDSADEIRGGMDYEYTKGSRHSGYSRMELEKDDIEGLSLRATAAAGYGYYFMKEDEHQLRGRIGVLVRHESYKGGDDTTEPGLALGLYHMVVLGRSKLITDLQYEPSVEDFNKYLIFHTTSWEIPITGDEMWKLRLGVATDYNSLPPQDKKHVDLKYFARLVLTL